MLLDGDPIVVAMHAWLLHTLTAGVNSAEPTGYTADGAADIIINAATEHAGAFSVRHQFKAWVKEVYLSVLFDNGILMETRKEEAHALRRG